MKVEWASRACPLCGAPGNGPVFAESNIDLTALDGFAFASRKLPEYMHPRLIDCRGCGLLFGNPVLSAEMLAGAYRSAAFDTSSEAHDAARTYARGIRKILPRLPDRNGALDIGTGDGAFLEELLALGFQNVEGIEPSEAPRADAKTELRPLIRLGVFRREDFSAGRFALVTCFQTMEHVWDPLDIARSALALLKPGGAFVVVVHNREAFSAKVMGLKSPIFDIEHLQLFSPHTARALMSRAGFTNISVDSFWNRYPVSYCIKLLPLSRCLKAALLGCLKRSVAGRVPVPLPAGNLFCVGFKPSVSKASKTYSATGWFSKAELTSRGQSTPGIERPTRST